MGSIQKAEKVLLKSRWSEQSKRTHLDCQLWDKVWSFGDYFTDMLFESGSVTDSFLKCAGGRRKFCVIDNPRQYENLRLSQE